jgi:hypothetical protein
VYPKDFYDALIDEISFTARESQVLNEISRQSEKSCYVVSNCDTFKREEFYNHVSKSITGKLGLGEGVVSLSQTYTSLHLACEFLKKKYPEI